MQTDYVVTHLRTGSCLAFPASPSYPTVFCEILLWFGHGFSLEGSCARDGFYGNSNSEVVCPLRGKAQMEVVRSLGVLPQEINMFSWGH